MFRPRKLYSIDVVFLIVNLYLIGWSVNYLDWNSSNCFLVLAILNVIKYFFYNNIKIKILIQCYYVTSGLIISDDPSEPLSSIKRWKCLITSIIVIIWCYLNNETSSHSIQYTYVRIWFMLDNHNWFLPTHFFLRRLLLRFLGSMSKLFFI